MGVQVSKFYRPPSEISAEEKDAIFGKPPATNNVNQRDLSLSLVAHAIKSGRCKRIMLLCGAGISVSAGIPDFRTPGTGLYDNLQVSLFE